MSGTRTRRIIAVFGGDTAEDVRTRAEEFGRSIAERRQILLTGGTESAPTPVKNRAILGAHPSPWVGVDRKKSGGASSKEREPRAFLICSDLDHKRNYLEAYMCDAAIGLKGGDGTVSELTCALWLKRPVAFVGDYWRGSFDLDASRSQALDRLVEATVRRFGSSQGSDALDETLTEKAIRDGLASLPDYRYFDSQTTARAVVDWIMSVLPDDKKLQGAFPPVRGHEAVATAYREWLAEQE